MFSAVDSAQVESEHYKINVGQGECSTSIVTIKNGDEDTKIAVTADIGSSSLQYDPKYEFGGFKNIFIDKVLTADRSSEQHSVERVRKRSRSSEESDSLSEYEDGSDSSSVTAYPRASHAGGSSLKSSFTFLSELLNSVKVWIVFLSHSDADHINKLKEVYFQIEGEKPKILLIAGGEWFNSNSTEDIREILNFIQTTKCFYFFPYEEAKASSSVVYSMLENGNPKIEKGDPSSFNPQNEVSMDMEEFHGTLSECLRKFNKKDIIKRKLHISEDYYNFLEQKVLDTIYIWSLDYRIGNCNAQSLVWSHKLDDLGMTFVYTGDAEQETFEKIKKVIQKSNLIEKQKFIKSILRGRSQDHLVILQGMHHGSRENIPPILSEQQRKKGEQQQKICAIDLFQPDVCVFSAGNGVKYAHPAVETVARFKEEMGVSGLFWSRYTITALASFVAFSSTKDGREGKAIKITVQENDPVILCTNIQGTIKFSKDGISVPYSNIQNGYFLHDSNHAFIAKSPINIDAQEIEKGTLTENNLGNVQANYKDFYKFFVTVTRINKISHGLYELVDNRGVNEQYQLKLIERNSKQYFYILQKIESQAVHEEALD